MKRVSAIELQERLRLGDATIVCVTRRRAPSVDDVVRRLDAACARTGAELITVDGDDHDTAALLPDLGVTTIPAVLITRGGVLLERVSTVRDNTDARRLAAIATAGATTPPRGVV